MLILARDSCFETNLEAEYLWMEKKNFHDETLNGNSLNTGSVVPQTIIEKRKKDEEANCAICNSGDYEQKNMIVFCESCGIAVHQNCYGINNLPENEWRCLSCCVFGFQRSRCLQCSLCGWRGGAMRPSGVPSRDHLMMRDCIVYSTDIPLTKDD